MGPKPMITPAKASPTQPTDNGAGNNTGAESVPTSVTNSAASSPNRPQSEGQQQPQGKKAAKKKKNDKNPVSNLTQQLQQQGASASQASGTASSSSSNPSFPGNVTLATQTQAVSVTVSQATPPISMAKRPSMTGLRGASAWLSRSPAKSLEETMFGSGPVASDTPPGPASRSTSSASMDEVAVGELEAAIEPPKQQETAAPPKNNNNQGNNNDPNKKLTKEERRALQEQQIAAKAAKRAAAAAAAGNAPAGGSSNVPKEGKGKATKNSQGNNGSSTSLASSSSPAGSQGNLNTVANAGANQKQGGNASGGGKPGRSSKGASSAMQPSVGGPKPVSLLSHLHQHQKGGSQALDDLRAQGHVHPAIISLGVQFSEFIISGGSARCVAMLSAFKKVISDYVTPPGTSLQRNLTSHIGKQIDYMVLARSLADSMKTAIRLLKSEVSNISLDMADEDAKEYLRDWIDQFIKEKITVAASAISGFAMEKIRDGDVILTFARSSVVEKLLLEAHEEGIQFSVIVCDSRPKLEGKVLLRNLASAGIHCTYTFTSSLGSVINKATKLIIGAAALLSNGSVMSRTGTAIVAMMAHDAHLPVMVLCEQYKFTEIVRLDSFVWNEIGDPDELVNINSSTPAVSLPPLLAPLSASSSVNATYQKSILSGWHDVLDLKLLHIYYDITPASYISLVVCENGCLPSTSVLSVLGNMEREKRLK